MIESMEQKIIRERLAELNPNKGIKTMKENEVYAALTAEFPTEAYSVDSSRGFDLTSIKAQYVVDRLNSVLGVMNWSHGGEYKETENGVIFIGTLVVTVDGKQNRQMAPGYSADKKNMGDAYKGAKTDSLSKAASMFGVGDSVFKGKVSAKDVKAGTAGATVTKVAAPLSAAASTETKAPASFQTRTRKKAVENDRSSDDI